MGPDLVAVGEVVGARGVAGELRVRPLTDRPQERFGALERCVVWEPATDARWPHRVASCRFDRDLVLVRLVGVDTLESAVGLVGRLLAVDAREAFTPPPGHFYPWQLAGARVETIDGREVGRFLGVESGAAQDLWVVASGPRTWLVPAVPEIVRDVDVAGGRVVIDPPDGLLDL